jgi:glycosyltransferase involved in cell wall biosynthesis
MTEPVARLLDLTRLLSRAGRNLTGIDRVERAYLLELLKRPTPLFGLVRTSLGYLLLDRKAFIALDASLVSGFWGKADLLSRLASKGSPERKKAESLLRGLSVARCLPVGLGRMLRQHLPAGTEYFNVGHSDLTPRVLAALRQVPNIRLSIMIHDTIPLDYPALQRPGTPGDFAAKLALVGRHADRVLCPSQVVEADLRRHLALLGPVPEVIAVPLGVTVPRPDPARLPAHVDLTRPYFVVLGTIEPRKNHALLLDVWEALGPDRPTLFVCGRRGWLNADVFARLDAHPPGVVELPGLPDEAVAALLKEARALLFPSIAEGFGIPLVEAAALGTPVLCGDLAICREVLGDAAVYLPLNDHYVWIQHVMAAVSHAPAVNRTFVAPDWATHFKTVLGMT